jgi:Predicted helicase
MGHATSILTFTVRTEFGLEDGLADTTTWGEMVARHAELTIPEGVPTGQAFVQILDPATGTGTFIVEVIELIHRTMVAKWKVQGHRDKQIAELWNEYVPKHLLPRVHGYELLMAPYAIAHLKIGLKLYETGYRFESDERARVYLTNALEPGDSGQQLTFEFLEALAHEAEQVRAIKLTCVFSVVIGNPPYSSVSMNMNDYIWELVNEYLLLPDGPIKERSNRNHLQDDYVKFMRFGQLQIEKSGVGVLGLITNNSYLSGPWYRGMRYHLLRTFTKINIL